MNKDKLGEYIKILLQVGALVWGAATLTSRVNSLDKLADSQGRTIESLQAIIQSMQIEHARDDNRIFNLEKGK